MSGAAEASGLSSAEPRSLCGLELGSGWAWALIGNRPGLRAHKSRQDNLADAGVGGLCPGTQGDSWPGHGDRGGSNQAEGHVENISTTLGAPRCGRPKGPLSEAPHLIPANEPTGRAGDTSRAGSPPPPLTPLPALSAERTKEQEAGSPQGLYVWRTVGGQ